MNVYETLWKFKGYELKRVGNTPVAKKTSFQKMFGRQNSNSSLSRSNSRQSSTRRDSTLKLMPTFMKFDDYELDPEKRKQ